jgi:tetratricopeptide (TPR) repeat protein
VLSPVARAEIPEGVRDVAWHRVETPHFTIFTNAQPGQGAAIARRLERLAAVLEGLLGLSGASAVPVYVYAFDGAGSFAPYQPARKERLDGYSWNAPDRRRIAYVIEPEREGDARTVYHEYVHTYLHNHFATLPLWLNEGLAQYLSTLVVKNDKVHIGRGIPWTLAWASGTVPIPLDVLLNVGHDWTTYQGGQETYTFYAESWALVHHLMHSTPDNRLAFVRYLQRIHAGGNALLSFEAEFPRDRWNSLMDGVRRHVDVGVGGFPYRILPLETLPAADAVETTPLEFPEIACRLGELLSLLGAERQALAEEHFRAALPDPRNRGAALAGLGYLRDLAGQTMAAESLYAEAVESSAEEPMACLLAGRGALRRTGATNLWEDRTPGPLLAARARFLCCLRSDGDNLEALAGFGQSFVHDPSPPAAAISALRLVAATEPSRTDVMRDLLLLLSRAGRLAEADSLAAIVEPRLPAENRPHVVARAAFLRAAWLRSTGREQEAEEVLSRAAAATSHAGIRGHLEQVLKQWRSGTPGR